MDKNTIKITVCMGSSCYSKGSSDLVKDIEAYKALGNSAISIEVCGCLCMDHCTNGPTIKIGDKIYENVTGESVISTLKQEYGL